MIPTKQLSLAALVWLGLANQGLALEIDQGTNDLTLVQRDPLHSGNFKVALAPGQKLPKVPRDLKVALAPNQTIPKVKHHHHHAKRYDGELETRQPILAPGSHRSSWGGQRRHGSHKPRDVEERDLDLETREGHHGSGRSGRNHAGHRHGPRDVEELDERDLEELEERDLEERKVSAKGVAKGIGKVAKGALKLLFRDVDERDLEGLDERDLEEIYERALDLETREHHHGSGRSGRSGAGHRHGTRDVYELDERDLEELEERDLEERKVSAKGVAKGIGKVAKGALKLLFRDVDERDLEELDERDLGELDERDVEELELEARSPIFIPGKHRSSFGGQTHGRRKPRDLDTRARRQGGRRQGGSRSHRHYARDVEELDERDIEEIELEARSPIFIPGKHRSSFGGQSRGGRKPRDLEARKIRAGGIRRGGSGPRRPYGRDLEERHQFSGKGHGRGPRRH